MSLLSEDTVSEASLNDADEPLTSSDSGDDASSLTDSVESTDTEAEEAKEKERQNAADEYRRVQKEHETVIRAELESEIKAAEEECVLAQPQLNFTLKVLQEAKRLKRNISRRELENRVDQYMRSADGVRESKKAYSHLNVPLSEVYAGLTPLHFDAKEYLRTLQQTDYLYVDEENDSEDGRDPDTEQHILDMFSLNLFHEAKIDAGPPVPAVAPERHLPRSSDALALVDRHWQLEHNWQRYHWQKDSLKQTKAERAILVHAMRQKRIRRQLIPYIPGNDVMLKRTASPAKPSAQRVAAGKTPSPTTNPA